MKKKKKQNCQHLFYTDPKDKIYPSHKNMSQKGISDPETPTPQKTCTRKTGVKQKR